MENLEEKTIAKETIFKGKVIELELLDVELPNGEKSKREIIKHPGAVAIIPLLSDGRLVLVEQFRKPLERTILEIPAGKMEQGEAQEVTAIRELEEETGYSSDNFCYLTSFYTAPGFADEILHIYVAHELKVVEKRRKMDADEFINLVSVTLEEAKQLISEQLIIDAKTMYAIQYLELQLNL
ncbi:NUDIX domain-containing protein [Listeria sp. PSOL-1]|uniref:NUDIX domain-containing protein n=1 Tax=Listeria sp. PSOL-1 TaxID=1844999 RepID=UPI0013D01D04|nr:NUDIX hydrolase [Listeria sp. PSOL-1]